MQHVHLASNKVAVELDWSCENALFCHANSAAKTTAATDLREPGMCIEEYFTHFSK